MEDLNFILIPLASFNNAPKPECKSYNKNIQWLKKHQTMCHRVRPGSGGINKLPRNFLTDGTIVHQLRKSAKDIVASPFPSPCSENFAALRNMPTASWSEPSLGPQSLGLNIISKITARDDSKSVLTLEGQYYVD